MSKPCIYQYHVIQYPIKESLAFFWENKLEQLPWCHIPTGYGSNLAIFSELEKEALVLPLTKLQWATQIVVLRS
jgi:hypothetical protein